MGVKTYDPERVVLTFGSITVKGFGPDTFVKAARTEATFTTQVGCGGDVARTRNQNKTGTVEITLMATSQSNDQLTAVALLDEQNGSGIGAFQVKDLNSLTLCSGENAWIEKWPDMERAKETGVATWVLAIEKLNMAIGGATV